MGEMNKDEEFRHSEFRKAVDQVAEAAATKAGRRAGRNAAVGYFILILVMLVGAFIYQRNIDHRVYVALDRGCTRLNTLRVQEANQGFQSIWKAFYLARERAEKLKQSASDPKIREANRKATVAIDELISNLKWTPATDCPAFAHDPDGYAPPEPKLFTKPYLDLRKVPK